MSGANAQFKNTFKMDILKKMCKKLIKTADNSKSSGEDQAMTKYLLQFAIIN